MQRGDIVLVRLPDSNESGHEQTGKRPALVVHNDATSGNLSLIMIVPVTSNQKTKRFPHTILVEPSAENGLDAPSVLLVFQLRAIDKKRIIKKIGVLESSIMEKINEEMKRLLGL